MTETLTIEERLNIILSLDGVDGSTKSFVESLKSNFEKSGRLSMKQVAVLERIEKRLDPANIKENESFKRSWGAEKKKIALICAQYYKRVSEQFGTYYFGTLCDKILNENEDFVPSKAQYNAMTRSAYAKRAVKAATEPYKFEVGDLVMYRKNIPYTQIDTYARGEYGDDVMVLSQDKTKGLQYKQYLVFQVKNPKVQFYIQERFLKKMPKNRSE